jgi:hypothetical protein
MIPVHGGDAISPRRSIQEPKMSEIANRRALLEAAHRLVKLCQPDHVAIIDAIRALGFVISDLTDGEFTCQLAELKKS